MVFIQIRAIRQFHGNVSCLADRHLRVGDGASGIGMLHLDGQRPTVAVRVLIASSDLAVLVGLTAAGGNGDLARGVGLTGGVVIILVCNGNAHARYSALVLDELHGDGGLVCVVQQAAIGQADGDRIILMERHGGVCYGILGVGIGDGHKVATHNGLTLTVRGGAVVDLFNGLCLQLFATHGTLLVLAALRVGGRLLVNDPVAGLMTGRFGVVALVGIAAASTGVSGIAHLRAGGSRHFGLVIMSQSLFQHGAAAGAELGVRAGSRSAGDVAICGVSIQTVAAAAGAAVFHNPLASAGGVGDKGALVPAVAQGFRIVRDKGTAASIAAMDGLSLCIAGSLDHMSLVIMRNGGSNVLDMAVTANGAFPDGIAGAGTGGGHGIDLIAVFAFGRGGLLHLAAAGAKLQQLAIGFAGSVTDDDALPCVAQRVHIVALFDFAALRTEVAVIAEGGAAGLGAVQQNILVVFTAALVGAAISVAMLVLAAAIGVRAAAAAVAVLVCGIIPQPDIGHTVFRHIHTVTGVGDFVIDSVLTLVRIVGRGSHGAAIRAVAVTDIGADTGFRQVRNADGMGLSVYHAVVAGNNGLGRRVVISGIVTQAALLHGSETAMSGLGQSLHRHVMAFQHRGSLVIRTVTEAAVGAALGDSAVVLAVYIFVGNGLRQIQIKFGGAVMQNVDVLIPCVGGAVGLVTVPVSTAAAYGFGPVVTGVIGVLAGDTGIQTAYRYFVNTHPVGILDVAVQGRLTGAGILRNTPDGEIRVFPAGGAVEGLVGDDGVDIQFIRPVAGLLPMLDGIMVAVLLGG